jgi:hypothetical protein
MTVVKNSAVDKAPPVVHHSDEDLGKDGVWDS